MGTAFKRIWQGAITLTLCVVIWHMASSTGLFGRTTPASSHLLLPLPSQVLSTLFKMARSGYLLENVSISVLRVLCGFVIAAAVAIPLGVAMASSSSVYNFADPVVRLLSPIPGVAWVPIAILWFGLGDQAAIFIIAVGSIFPILLSTIQGVQDADPRLIDAARTMGASRLQILRRVMLPSLIPYLVTGLRSGLSFSWRVVIAAEMVGVPKGIGYMLTIGRSTGQTDVTLVTMFVLGALMVFVEEFIFNPLQNSTSSWKRSAIS